MGDPGRGAAAVKRAGVFLAVGAAALVAQMSLFTLLPFGVLKPDLVLLLVLYLGARSDPIEGGAIAFCLGYGMDILSGASFGTFTITKVLVFFGAYLAAKRVYLTAGSMPAVAAALVTLLEALVIRLLHRAVGLDGSGLDGAMLRYLVPQALLMAVLAPFVFHYVGRLDARLGPRAAGIDDRRPAPLA